MSLLFSPITLGGVELKNRIVMSPMCMFSSTAEDGQVTPWHQVHYVSRAVGQVGLIIAEATAVLPEGRISKRDLGLWEDAQIPGFRSLTEQIHANGSKAGIQLAHAGRKSEAVPAGAAPSAIAFPGMPEPRELTLAEIDGIVDAFAAAASRAAAAGFDVIELHAAHGYLLNQFLTPLANKREDEYGAGREGRFLLVRRVVEAVKKVWTGPLFVRISADEYDPQGSSMEDILYYVRELGALGVHLIDCSSGGVVPASIQVVPGYQVKYAAEIKERTGVPSGAVGLITGGAQAEDILKQSQADLIFIGRGLLKDPYWARTAAAELGAELKPPVQYYRSW
ncbi:NADPH dehydrogenase NamA [Gorillibacterium sp. sgz5001074]|uniref:NADPH dehydrogenase NamA n=1 Tax=Gorillibacterium sp. sgz5001074 TaxID=3446695 RepID=UPI003F669530